MLQYNFRPLLRKYCNPRSSIICQVRLQGFAKTPGGGFFRRLSFFKVQSAVSNPQHDLCCYVLKEKAQGLRP
jgi:hypothetical protein